MQNKLELNFERAVTALVIATFLGLAFVAFTLTVDFYDTFDYIISSWNLFGDRISYFFPKNPLLVTFYCIIYFPFWIFEKHPSLLAYHVPMFLVNSSFVLLTAFWIKKYFTEIPLVILLGLATWNRIFIHYAPFGIPDLSCAACVALWFFVDSTKSKKSAKWNFIRILILAACAFGRIQTVFIPAVSLIYEVITTRNWKRFLLISVTGFFFYLLFLALLFGTAHGHPLADGLTSAYYFFERYFKDVASQHHQPFYIYFEYLFLGLTIPGTALVLLGIYAYWKSERKQQERELNGPLLGSVFFLLFLLNVAQKEARYIAQILPACVLLQCFAIRWLQTKRRHFEKMSLLALFCFALPELVHFADPFYRKDFPGQATRKISEWSKSEGFLMLSNMHAFYSKKHYFHWNDPAFYNYHWGPGAIIFFSQKPVQFVGRALTFSRFGYPIPDDISNLGPEGVTMVLPKTWTNTTTDATADIPPLFAMRWWRAKPTPETQCDNRVPELCVEVLAAFPGYAWND